MEHKSSAKLACGTGTGRGAKSACPALSDLQKNFCLSYVKQGCCNATGALEAAGSRASYASRRAAASKLLTKDNIIAEIRRLNAKADKKARNKEDHALASVAERKRILSAIIRANATDLRGISVENGSLVFDDAACREAVNATAQIVVVPDPYNAGKKTKAILVSLTLHDPIKAIQELNRMEGVYKDTPLQPAEIHIHTGKTLEHDEQTAAQLDDPACRVPIPGSLSDQKRFRTVNKTDPFAALMTKCPSR